MIRWLSFAILLFLVPPLCDGQVNTLSAIQDCSSAPSEALKAICRQIHSWDADSRQVVNISSRPSGSVALAIPSRPSSAYECFDINCLCFFLFGDSQNGGCLLQNGQTYRKAVRKEFRMLSEMERNNYVRAFLAISQNGNYSDLSSIHRNIQVSPGAHSGPAFLPWHREFIKRFEIALRLIDSSISLPYWDSTLETALQNPQDSILFSPQFFGNTQGTVNTGIFANFNGLGNGAPTRRQMAANQPVPFEESDIQATLAKNTIDQVLAFTAPQQGCPFRTNFDVLEYEHGKPHVFVGGDMFEPRTSTNDPLFWLHHSFVDFIWEMWRLQKQSRDERSSQYPSDNIACSSRAHFGDSIMAPFSPLANKDGLSNSYTDNLYEYSPRPSCSMGDNCGSEFLFCDRSNGQPRCASKMKIGGNCRGYVNGEQACYQGTCWNGVCSAQSPNPTTGPTAPPTVPPMTTTTRRNTQPTRPTQPNTIGPLPPITYPPYNPYNNGQGPVYVEPGYGNGNQNGNGYPMGPNRPNWPRNRGNQPRNGQNGNRNQGNSIHIEPGAELPPNIYENQQDQPTNPYLPPRGK